MTHTELVAAFPVYEPHGFIDYDRNMRAMELAMTGTGESVRPLEAGDVGVIVSDRGVNHEARVIKVGRRWATVEPAFLGRYDRFTGAQDGGNYPSSATFYTPERFAHCEAMKEARSAIKARGVEFRLGERWADDDVLALAAWLANRFHIDGDRQP